MGPTLIVAFLLLALGTVWLVEVDGWWRLERWLWWRNFDRAVADWEATGTAWRPFQDGLTTDEQRLARTVVRAACRLGVFVPVNVDGEVVVVGDARPLRPTSRRTLEHAQANVAREVERLRHGHARERGPTAPTTPAVTGAARTAPRTRERRAPASRSSSRGGDSGDSDPPDDGESEHPAALGATG